MTSNAGNILALNAGSSSLKFAVFSQDRGNLRQVCAGQIEGLGTHPRLTISDCGGTSEAEASPDETHASSLHKIFALLAERDIPVHKLAGTGHRIVHGGARYSKPTRIDLSRLDELDALRQIAPLHNPFGLDTLRTMLALLPDTPQIACFDTAFHAQAPKVAQRFALPASYFERGYRRYGFHGLNYEHVVAELPRLSGRSLPQRLITFHLGNGCSVCAIRDGRSVATSMGYTPLDGLVMGTRCGAIDPGLLIELMRDFKLDAQGLSDLLYKQSGLLGLSGVTSDMRTLLASDNPACSGAIEHFCYWAARHAGSMATACAGVDAIVFTGGIGANAAKVRELIGGHLAYLGVAIDTEANRRHAPLISRAGSSVEVRIVPADEERVIARHVVAELSNRAIEHNQMC